MSGGTVNVNFVKFSGSAVCPVYTSDPDLAYMGPYSKGGRSHVDSIYMRASPPVRDRTREHSRKPLATLGTHVPPSLQLETAAATFAFMCRRFRSTLEPVGAHVPA